MTRKGWKSVTTAGVVLAVLVLACWWAGQSFVSTMPGAAIRAWPSA